VRRMLEDELESDRLLWAVESLLRISAVLRGQGSNDASTELFEIALTAESTLRSRIDHLKGGSAERAKQELTRFQQWTGDDAREARLRAPRFDEAAPADTLPVRILMQDAEGRAMREGRSRSSPRASDAASIPLRTTTQARRRRYRVES
jgi:hypothetical protein